VKFEFSCPKKLKYRLHGREESGEHRIFLPHEAKKQAAWAGKSGEVRIFPPQEAILAA